MRTDWVLIILGLLIGEGLIITAASYGAYLIGRAPTRFDQMPFLFEWALVTNGAIAGACLLATAFACIICD